MAKDQHTVPKLLLRRFAVPRKKGHWIHIFDKRDGSERHQNVDNVAFERYYYDLGSLDDRGRSLDTRLENDVETPAALALSRLAETERVADLTPAQREVIARFIAVQELRTRDFHSHLRQTEAVAAAAMHRAGALPEDYRPPTDDDVRRVQCEVLERLAEEAIPALLRQVWCLLKTTPEAPFVLGDAPVARQNVIRRNGDLEGGLGLGDRGVEVYLPISPTLTLQLHCPEAVAWLRRQRFRWMVAARGRALPARDPIPAFDGLRPDPVTPENVGNVNWKQVQHAHRYIYSAQPGFAGVRAIIARDENLRAGLTRIYPLRR